MVKQTVFCGLLLLLALPACRRNEPQEEKKTPEARERVPNVEPVEKEKPNAKKETPKPEIKVSGPPRVGEEAPEISGKDLDGVEFKLSDYRGKVVLLDFWGNW